MDALATTLLRRKGRLYLAEAAPAPPVDAERWVRMVEIDLADRGWFLSAVTRARLALLDRNARAQWADWMLAVADQSVGAHRVHSPLFKSFPNSPSDPDALFIERLLAHWFQDSDVGCILCGQEGTIRPVDPCGHLVCEQCFDPDAYSACPICGRRAAGAGVIEVTSTRPAGAPLRLTRIDVGEDMERDAIEARNELITRPGALGELERSDLQTLIEATSPVDISWMPDQVPSRETPALVAAWALQRAVLPHDQEAVLRQVAARWGTATDIARTLWAYSGGDAGLVLPSREQPGPDEHWRPRHEPAVHAQRPRVRALPRPIRRAVMTTLESLGAASSAEDMNRHPTVWKRLAERIHPFEWIRATPEAAVAFAAVRSTRTRRDSPLGRAIAQAAERHAPLLQIIDRSDGRISVKARTFASVVEEALNEGDLRRAISVLQTRPGELWRRVDHLSRVAGDDASLRASVADAARDAAAAVAPGVLAAAAAELNGRESTVRAGEAVDVAVRADAAHQEEASSAPRLGRWLRIGGGNRARGTTGVAQRPRPQRPPAPPPGSPRRVFFPRGDVVRSWTAPERRDPLPKALVTELRATVDRELARRASILPSFDLAIIDAKLLDVPAPNRARASSAQLAGWTRGTRLQLPEFEVLRLFLHWVELPSVRVDLDLSCAFYGNDWAHAGHCDYTSLRFSNDAAIHSGDFTSAPQPFGATEFLDLTIAELAAAEVRFAVPVVFSYNDVPFERLPEAFAGFSLPTARDAQFDAGRVVQRFDLRGDARMLVPFIIDVANAELLWVDVHVTSRGFGHRAGRHSSNLGRLGADLWDHFTARSRPTMLDLAMWHAVGRANDVYVADFEAHSAVRIARDADAAAMTDVIRRMATTPPENEFPSVDGLRTLAIARDADVAADVLGTSCHVDSVAAAPVGRARAPWLTIRPEGLLAGLTVVKD